MLPEASGRVVAIPHRIVPSRQRREAFESFPKGQCLPRFDGPVHVYSKDFRRPTNIHFEDSPEWAGLSIVRYHQAMHCAMTRIASKIHWCLPRSVVGGILEVVVA